MRLLTAILLSLAATSLLALQGCSSGKVPANDPANARRVTADEEKSDKEAKKEEAGAPFELPKDGVGQLLGKVLPPQRTAGPLGHGDRPKPPPAPLPRAADLPAVLPLGTALVARLPSPARKEVLRPRLVIDESFDGGLGEPLLPRSPTFDAGKPTSVESEDVSIPPPLPIMAVRVPDRVAADDFTTEASTEAVLKATLPGRTRPAPFTKSGVPEPFENRKPLPTKTPDEETTPVSDGPVVPKP